MIILVYLKNGVIDGGFFVVCPCLMVPVIFQQKNNMMGNLSVNLAMYSFIQQVSFESYFKHFDFGSGIICSQICGNDCNFIALVNSFYLVYKTTFKCGRYVHVLIEFFFWNSFIKFCCFGKS